MKTKVELKASGDNASGKSYLLSKIKSFLETEGIVADFDSKDEHKLIVINNRR